MECMKGVLSKSQVALFFLFTVSCFAPSVTAVKTKYPERFDAESIELRRKFLLSTRGKLQARSRRLLEDQSPHLDVKSEESVKQLEEGNTEIEELLKKAQLVIAEDKKKLTHGTEISDPDVNSARKSGLSGNDTTDPRKLREIGNAEIPFFGKDESHRPVDRRPVDDITENMDMADSRNHVVHPPADEVDVIAEALRIIGEHNNGTPRSNGTESVTNKISNAALGLLKSATEDERNVRNSDKRGNPEQPISADEPKSQPMGLNPDHKMEDQVKNLTRLLNISSRESLRLKLALGKARKEFDDSIEQIRNEQKEELDEMRTTINEQKQAFDELFAEKQLITKVLAEEQRTLKDFQKRIEHPDFSLWLRQRAERAAVLMENPETDAMKFYAQKFMAPHVDKLRHRLDLVEGRIERTVDHFLPARYGWFVAVMLSAFIIGFPLFIVMSTMVTLSTSMSSKQYVLLGNLFLTAMATAICVVGVVLRQDPLQTLYEAGKQLFIVMQLGMALAFPCFVATIFLATLRGQDRLERFIFGCQLVFYLLAGLNYHSHVWRPVMLGQNIRTSSMMYLVFLVDFVAMTILTVSVARVPDRSGFLWDLESAESKAPAPSPWSSNRNKVGKALLSRALGTGGNGETGKTE